MKEEQPLELDLSVHCLEEHKAEGVEVIDVSGFSPFASYYVLATAPNPRALGALKDHLCEAFESNGIDVPVSEGKPESGWIIVQGGEVICQLFLAPNRKEIGLADLLKQLGATKEN
ncbi:MAG: RsfS/YbeB/iojap family protein [Candidatus Enteromonas sp.]